MSSVTPSESSRIQGSDLAPLHYKPFSSHEHYQQVMDAHRKLLESGFYFGPIGGLEAKALLSKDEPGTFLIRDSSDRRYFFTLSVQTVYGTKNLRIHSEEGGFFLENDYQNKEKVPRFDCVLKLITFYMGRGRDVQLTVDGASEGSMETIYLMDSRGIKTPLELLKPLKISPSSLKHICRRALNRTGQGEMQQLPQTLRDFMEKYDASI
ncbi:suppressor of cytokine signaling 3b [Gambusia affinis]|nr:suppressor of cytokine signaling 3b [Gambusia affinis]XP_043957477.1 suppressor of cytokine signaling 3b [Gambusia affinis]